MTELTIQFESNPNKADIEFIGTNLFHFNNQETGISDFKRLTFFLRNKNQQILGGLCGYTRWSWLHVDNLWLDPSIRGKGYGTRLLMAAEKEALLRGCNMADLDTFSFQARGF